MSFYSGPQMLFPDPRDRSPTAYGFDGLTDDTQAAMQAAPGYWLAWYSIKSIALVGVVAWFAYYAGKHSSR